MARRVRHSRLGFRIAGAVQPPDVIVFGGFVAGSGGATASSGGASVVTTMTGCVYRADGGGHAGDFFDGYIESHQQTTTTGDAAPLFFSRYNTLPPVRGNARRLMASLSQAFSVKLMNNARRWPMFTVSIAFGPQRVQNEQPRRGTTCAPPASRVCVGFCSADSDSY